jgi:hypothetical protein
MLTTHRPALVAACALPLLLAGCTATAPNAKTDVALVHPSPRPIRAPRDAEALPATNPVEVRVTGTVLSSTGGRMPGASIAVRPASTSRDCLTCGSVLTRTDAAGRFAFTLVRGSYLITCRSDTGAVCRIEGDAVPSPFTLTSGSRDLVLTTDRAGSPR